MFDLPEPVSLETTSKIIGEMKNNICSIILGNETTSGFFCKIPFPDKEHSLHVLISNSQSFKKYSLDKEKEIVVLTENEKSTKHIKLNNRIIYINEDFNFLLIEIKEDTDGIHNFFELDDNIIYQETKKCLKQSIYILQNSEYKSYVFYGIIADYEDCNDHNFVHIDNLKENSFYSPILNLLNNKLIGINIKKV